MNEDAVVDALKRFDLSTYEARTFVALQKLSVASASEIAEIADVPRSQVYGATDELEERGLVDVQKGTPTRFRPVSVEEARERLYDQLRSVGEEAFSYLESIEGDRATEAERSEAIWTVEGSENVAARAVSLIEDAESLLIYGVETPDLLESNVIEALDGAIERGVTVGVVSTERAVLDAAEETIPAVETWDIPDEMDPEVSTGRVLRIDGETILLSVRPTDSMPHVTEETAFWSAQTAVATMLVGLIREWFDDPMVE